MERTNPKGYYTEDINFSVEFYNSSWIMRCRLEQDELAKTQEQKDAIRYWINSNKRKYEEAKAEREMTENLNQINAERHNFGKQWAEMLEKKDYDSLKEAERAAEKAESICRYLRRVLIWKAKERLELETQERLWKERTEKNA
jgi:hypothetical protein